MKHGVRWLAIAASFALLATACGGGDEGGGSGPTGGGATGNFDGVTITFSTSLAETEVAAVEEVVGNFEAQTGATVKFTQVDSASLPQKLKVEVDSGNHTIHLFAQDNLALAGLVDDGLVEDLSDVEIPDGVNPALVPEKFDGVAYFLPYRPNVKVVYVNKGRFDEAGATPPATVDDFVATAEELKADAGQPKVVLQLEGSSGAAAVTVSEWIVGYGGDPLILNDQGSVDAFTELQSLWQDQLIAQESLQSKYDTDVDYLSGETAWMAQNWPFTSATFADQGILSEFTVYKGWDYPVQPAHVIGGEVLGIPKGVSGQEKEAAVALAQYLMSQEAQQILVAKNAWPSVRDDALGQVPQEQQETFDAIQGALENGWYRPNVVYWPDVDEAINDAIQRIMVNGDDVQSTLDDLHGKIEQAAQSAGETYPPAA
jgi:trehalose transport system substrate-binding protein